MATAPGTEIQYAENGNASVFAGTPHVDAMRLSQFGDVPTKMAEINTNRDRMTMEVYG